MASKREYDQARAEANRERSRSAQRTKRIAEKMNKNKPGNKAVIDRWNKARKEK